MHMYVLTCMVIIQRSSTLDVMDVVGSEDEYRELGPQRSLKLWDVQVAVSVEEWA